MRGHRLHSQRAGNSADPRHCADNALWGVTMREHYTPKPRVTLVDVVLFLLSLFWVGVLLALSL